MSKLETQYPTGSTPLDPNETAGLILDYISTQGELNIVEQKNILEASTWAFSKRHTDVLSATFILALHRRMFGDVWRWAGKVRSSEKNIGVPKDQIIQQLAQLLGNTSYWIDNETMRWDELGARFHRQLVWIHVFANGNGRHARLMTDVLLRTHGQEPFTWGHGLGDDPLEAESSLRKEYIKASRSADKGDFSELVQFARS